MIKSLLDDEENSDKEGKERSRYFGIPGDSEGFLSLELSSPSEKEPPRAGESEDEIKTAIEDGLPPVAVSAEPNIGMRPVESSDPEESERSLHEHRANELEQMLAEIEQELEIERHSLRVAEMRGGPEPSLEAPAENVVHVNPAAAAPTSQPDPGEARPGPVPFSPEPYEPESEAGIFRKSGMAWSAAIALFGSVVFMLVLGWFADLLLGSSPWGKVVGIVIGSLIGFVQFFRITSQILKPRKSDFEKVSLRTSDDGSEDDKAEETPD